MSTKLVALRDGSSGAVNHIDLATGRIYADPEGLRFVRDMVPTEYILGEKGQPVRDPVTDQLVHVGTLSRVAAEHYHQSVSDQYRRPVKVQARDYTGQLFTLDLAPSDVHTPATLPNYAAGYHLGESVADIVSPAILVPKQSDVFYTWNVQSDFQRKVPNASSPGGAVSEVNPGLAPSTYTTIEYALGGFLPTEIQANADTPLKPFTKMTQVIVDGLRLEREFRVSTLLQTSGSWNANLVTTLASGTQWDGGASSDPVANLHKSIEQSYLPVTAIVMSELVWHDFLRNPAVQKYFTFKDSVTGLPGPQELATTLKLPPIFVAPMKYLTNGGTLTYMWGNHVVLLHQPKQQPPTDQMDVATSYTFRWTGGTAPDGTPTAGLLVRTFFDPKRGARGGTQVVTVVNDTELMTSGLVGGLILNAHI